MIKYLSSSVTLAEFPDEIALCLNITNCPCFCEHCSEPELRPDIGTPVTEEELHLLVNSHPGISLIGFLGGDSDHDSIAKLVDCIHRMGLKVGMYSGLDELDPILLNSLDYYKIGRWIMPKGPVESWHKQVCGPLKFPFSNQLMFKKENGIWKNITYRFREQPLNNLEKEII